MRLDRHEVIGTGDPAGTVSHRSVHRATGEGTFWLNWVGANAIGELFGLGAVAVVAMMAGPVLLGSDETLAERLLFAVVMIAAGAFEGFVVGLAQWRVLRSRFPTLPRAAWLRATIAGAVIAWILGMLPSTLLSGPAPDGTVPAAIDRSTVYLLAAAMGCALGAILGFPQSRVLRSHVDGAGIWIAANALAWMIAMPIIFIGAGSVGRLGATAGPIVLGAATILVAGAICGAIHGALLIRLLRARVKSIAE